MNPGVSAEGRGPKTGAIPSAPTYIEWRLLRLLVKTDAKGRYERGFSVDREGVVWILGLPPYSSLTARALRTCLQLIKKGWVEQGENGTYRISPEGFRLAGTEAPEIKIPKPRDLDEKDMEILRELAISTKDGDGRERGECPLSVGGRDGSDESQRLAILARHGLVEYCPAEKKVWISGDEAYPRPHIIRRNRLGGRRFRVTADGAKKVSEYLSAKGKNVAREDGVIER